MAFAALHAQPIVADDADVDRINVGLALVNWCVLLLLFCALLLAKTLPSGAQLTGGISSEDCKTTSASCQDVKPAKASKSKAK